MDTDIVLEGRIYPWASRLAAVAERDGAACIANGISGADLQTIDVVLNIALYCASAADVLDLGDEASEFYSRAINTLARLRRDLCDPAANWPDDSATAITLPPTLDNDDEKLVDEWC